MSLVVLAGVAMMLVPLLVLVGIVYEDWCHRRAARQEAARAEARRQAAGRRLVALDGGSRDAGLAV